MVDKKVYTHEMKQDIIYDTDRLIKGALNLER